MLVKELIEELKEFNPESKIVFHCSIESGRSVSVCEDGGMILDYDMENDEVFLEINGDETDWD